MNFVDVDDVKVYFELIDEVLGCFVDDIVVLIVYFFVGNDYVEVFFCGENGCYM